ncbi:FAD-dependent oxidoreductase [uncultured Meiothermus sp.]|jgi:thioredoxin reductase (NADPH)|uniref:FAD-dependent oxidoreductase n=1 Tax=uncultured Meiothermus sp. TaxID=157471 RepID=UPI002611BF83|nr:FAD-dependent oxidoreductase [uncultured Meiothermus sp.]
MAKPVLMTIDDDAPVLGAIAQDLRRKYGAAYRIVRASSGLEALDALGQLKERGDPVALLLSDHRMPQMDGVEFLERSRALYPEAKRALLTAYADTEAAIRAINKVRIDYYLMKPWDPPETQLYPVLDDLLEDWLAGYKPPFEGVRLLGHRWSPETHALKDFLARNHVPYQTLDLETMPEAQELYSKMGEVKLPVVLLPDGNRLESPSVVQLAQRIGLKTRADNPFYDLVIVGGGPAGLAAAVYGASEGLKVVMIEQEAPGGQAGTSSRIENYLGFPAGLSGGDLARRAVAQARKFDTEILTPATAHSLRTDGQYRILTLDDGSELSCHTLLIATGVNYRKLPVSGLDKLTGAGVYYGAAITEAQACKDEEVYIVGGGNSAGQAAVYLAQFARSVTLLVRGTGLTATMSRYLINQIEATPNIHLRSCTQVVEVHGDTHLEALTLADRTAGSTERVLAAALFIFIGALPYTDWLGEQIVRDDKGFVLTGPDLPKERWKLERDPYLTETSLPGVFAAGDVRHQSVKRVASAVGEGSITVQFVHQYLAAL